MRNGLRVNGADSNADRDTDVSVEYRPERIEPCACGGLIAADPTMPVAVHWAVVRHRRTWQHQRWLVRMEGQEED